MDRVLQHTTFAAPVTFSEDGVTVDPGTVTVGVAREDGTTLIAAGTATDGSGAAARTYTLTTTHTASLDVLTLTWTSATKGTLTTTVEVTGGFLFTLAQARAVSPLSNTTTYPTADLIAARVTAEDALEKACGVAFVPRYFRRKVDGTGGVDVLLPARPLSITSVVVGATSAFAGTTLTADELADLELYDDGRVYHSTGWTAGRRNVEIKGTRGYATLPPYVAEGAIALAKHLLVDRPTDDRATQIVGDDGTSQLLKADGTFGIPSADRVIELYGVLGGLG